MKTVIELMIGGSEGACLARFEELLGRLNAAVKSGAVTSMGNTSSKEEELLELLCSSLEIPCEIAGPNGMYVCYNEEMLERYVSGI